MPPWSIQISNDAQVGDTINLIIQTINVYSNAPYIKDIIEKLKAPDQLQFVKNVFDFVCTNVQYQKDPAGDENIYTPARLMQEGKGDCKKMTTFIAACLKAGEVEPLLKVISYDGKNYEHIFVICKINGQIIILDPVNNCQFNQEIPSKKNCIYNLKGDKKEMPTTLNLLGSAPGTNANMFDLSSALNKLDSDMCSIAGNDASMPGIPPDAHKIFSDEEWAKMYNSLKLSSPETMASLPTFAQWKMRYIDPHQNNIRKLLPRAVKAINDVQNGLSGPATATDHANIQGEITRIISGVGGWDQQLYNGKYTTKPALDQYIFNLAVGSSNYSKATGPGVYTDYDYTGDTKYLLNATADHISIQQEIDRIISGVDGWDGSLYAGQYPTKQKLDQYILTAAYNSSNHPNSNWNDVLANIATFNFNGDTKYIYVPAPTMSAFDYDPVHHTATAKIEHTAAAVAMFIPRQAFLLIVDAGEEARKLLGLHYADALAKYWNSGDIDDPEHLSDLWYKFGGDWKALKDAINTGTAHKYQLRGMGEPVSLSAALISATPIIVAVLVLLKDAGVKIPPEAIKILDPTAPDAPVTVVSTVKNPDGSSTVTYSDGTTSQIPAGSIPPKQGDNKPLPQANAAASFFGKNDFTNNIVKSIFLMSICPGHPLYFTIGCSGIILWSSYQLIKNKYELVRFHR